MANPYKSPNTNQEKKQGRPFGSLRLADVAVHTFIGGYFGWLIGSIFVSRSPMLAGSERLLMLAWGFAIFFGGLTGTAIGLFISRSLKCKKPKL